MLRACWCVSRFVWLSFHHIHKTTSASVFILFYLTLFYFRAECMHSRVLNLFTRYVKSSRYIICMYTLDKIAHCQASVNFLRVLSFSRIWNQDAQAQMQLHVVYNVLNVTVSLSTRTTRGVIVRAGSPQRLTATF